MKGFIKLLPNLEKIFILLTGCWSNALNPSLQHHTMNLHHKGHSKDDTKQQSTLCAMVYKQFLRGDDYENNN